MVPTSKESPGLCVDVMTAEQLSAVVGAAQVTAVSHSPVSAVCVMLAGIPEMVGASSSVMVMSKDVVVLLPQSSVAV